MIAGLVLMLGVTPSWGRDNADCLDTLIFSLNTATGDEALHSNTFGCKDTATGFGALFANTVGVNNTATGAEALSSNTTGFDNTGTGSRTVDSDAGQ